MAGLVQHADDLWSVAQPHTMVGLHLGTRMSVVRLSDGDVLLYSPVQITDDLGAAIDALGPVRWIVAPNAYHHQYADSAVARWPEATLLGAATLIDKRPDLDFGGLVSYGPFGAELQAIHIDGSMLDETVLWHPASGSVLSADLFENFHSCDHWPTRQYLKLNGVWQRPGWARVLRMVYRDRVAARESIDQVRALGATRAIVAHGDVWEGSVDKALADAFAWL